MILSLSVATIDALNVEEFEAAMAAGWSPLKFEIGFSVVYITINPIGNRRTFPRRTQRLRGGLALRRRHDPRLTERLRKSAKARAAEPSFLPRRQARPTSMVGTGVARLRCSIRCPSSDQGR